eukprot:361367-Chlamydomonas_euryale.AAC.11
MKTPGSAYSVARQRSADRRAVGTPCLAQALGVTAESSLKGDVAARSRVGHCSAPACVLPYWPAVRTGR